MKLIKTAFLALACLIIAAPSYAEPTADNTLEYPNNDSILAFYYHETGEKPSFDSWVEKHQDYRNASEFDRFDVKQRLIGEYEQMFGQMGGIEYIKIKTSTNISEYDGARKGYNLQNMSANLHYPFTAQNETIKLYITNIEEFGFWPIEVEEAKKVVNHLEAFSRLVGLEMTMKVTYVGPGKRNQFGQKVIQAHMEKLEIYGDKGATLLGTLTPRSSAEAAPVVQKTYEKKDFDIRKVDIDGLKIGMEVSEVEKWAKKKGFQIKSITYHDTSDKDVQKAMQKNEPHPNLTRAFEIVSDEKCLSRGNYNQRKYPEGVTCYSVVFNKGEKGLFGGDEATVSLIQFVDSIKADEGLIDQKYDTFLQKFGQPHKTVDGQLPQYGWGGAEGDVNKLPLSLQIYKNRAGKSATYGYGYNQGLNQTQLGEGNYIVSLKLQEPK
jgi:hypothetical protein